MNLQKTKTILQTQSLTGRKVSLLLAYVTEHGPQQEKTLLPLVRAHKPLRLAVSMDYLILTPDGRYSIGGKGREVVLWLMGSVQQPPSWPELELKASSVRVITRNRRGAPNE